MTCDPWGRTQLKLGQKRLIQKDYVEKCLRAQMFVASPAEAVAWPVPSARVAAGMGSLAWLEMVD
jgi:hypothetical protein